MHFRFNSLGLRVADDVLALAMFVARVGSSSILLLLGGGPLVIILLRGATVVVVGPVLLAGRIRPRSLPRRRIDGRRLSRRPVVPLTAIHRWPAPRSSSSARTMHRPRRAKVASLRTHRGHGSPSWIHLRRMAAAIGRTSQRFSMAAVVGRAAVHHGTAVHHRLRSFGGRRAAVVVGDWIVAAVRRGFPRRPRDVLLLAYPRGLWIGPRSRAGG